MTVEFSPRARGDLFSALNYLALERRGLAVDFLADVEHAVKLLADFPYAGVATDPPLRKLRLRRFRYDMFYRVQGDLVQVAGLVHMSRRPTYWRNHVDEPAPVYGLPSKAA